MCFQADGSVERNVHRWSFFEECQCIVERGKSKSGQSKSGGLLFLLFLFFEFFFEIYENQDYWPFGGFLRVCISLLRDI